MITIGPETKLRTIVANNVRHRRRALGWTQEYLAHRSKLHATEISRLERGLRTPRLQTVVQLAAALSCSIEDIATHQDDD